MELVIRSPRALKCLRLSWNALLELSFLFYYDIRPRTDLKLNKFEKVFGILLQMFGDDLNFRFDDVVTESYIRFTVVNYQLIQFKIFRFFFFIYIRQ